MVRVLGSSDDSGFNREPLGEYVKIKTEPGIEASEADRSPQTCEMKGSRIIIVLEGVLITRKLKRKIDCSIWKITFDPS